MHWKDKNINNYGTCTHKASEDYGHRISGIHTCDRPPMSKPKSLIITIIAVTVAAIVYGIKYGITWLIVCGMLRLIAWCFNLSFSWPAATCIWAALLFLKWAYNRYKN